MATYYETYFRKAWGLRNSLRSLIEEAKEVGEQGYITSSLNRVDMDLTGDIRYALSRIRDERAK